MRGHRCKARIQRVLAAAVDRSRDPWRRRTQFQGAQCGPWPGIQLGGRGIWFRENSYMETDVRNRPSGIKLTFRISRALPTGESQP